MRTLVLSILAVSLLVSGCKKQGNKGPSNSAKKSDTQTPKLDQKTAEKLARAFVDHI
jgi:PBP1b-binding outer membrane lipoprotein LpoB